MKSCFNRFLVGFLSVIFHGKCEDVPLAARRSTEAEMQATRERVESFYRSLPVESQPVSYILLGGRLAPAQIDPRGNIEYRWRDVLLYPAQVPRLEQSGSFGIFPIKPSGLDVGYIDPPIRYYSIAGTDRYGVGFYDAYNGVLYQWDHVQLSYADLPAGAEEKGLILSASTVAMSSVEAPVVFRLRDAAQLGNTGLTHLRPLPPRPPSNLTHSRSALETAAFCAESNMPVWLWFSGVSALLVIFVMMVKRLKRKL